MDIGLLRDLNAERRARRAVIALTDLDTGVSRLVRQGDSVEVGFAEPVAEAFRTGRSRPLEVEGNRLFLNVHLPPPRLVAIGAVHISQALAPMAQVAGFDLEIIDPRTSFATPARFPDVTVHADWPDVVLAARPLDAWTAVAALTHDAKIDDAPLQAALQAGCFYVGALGSRKTHASRVARLRVAGVTDADSSRIHAPIGLDIGASSPAEIAVAILGEIIAALRARNVGKAAVA